MQVIQGNTQLCRSQTVLLRQHAAACPAWQWPRRALASGATSSTTRVKKQQAATASLESVVLTSRDTSKAVSQLNEAFNQPTAQPPEAVKPGDADCLRFKNLHWSVNFWRDFNIDPSGALSDESASASERARVIGRILRKGFEDVRAFDSPRALAYWTYHVGRSGFFASQGVLGLMATQMASARRGDTSSKLDTGLLRMLNYSIRPIMEAISMYQQDWTNIQAGLYGLPWDMTPGHRQWNPSYVLRKTASFLGEASKTLQRRFGSGKEAVWLSSDLYPDYYLSTFHYQTDGWLSERSAQVYETSTETLFVGRQDAMQRQTLVPLALWLKECGNTSGDGLKLLEVGCGTGRFATFIKDNWRMMDVTAMDLSPYYLQEARRNMTYWKALRSPNLALGGVDGTGARFLQANAETVPEPDNSYDVVTSVYLFHELPPEARRNAAREMARLVKPGGLVVLTDSSQLGDRPINDSVMGNFGDFDEPWYRSYIQEDLGKLFEEVGLECDMKLLASSSKVLSFRKPAEAGPI